MEGTTVGNLSSTRATPLRQATRDTTASKTRSNTGSRLIPSSGQGTPTPCHKLSRLMPTRTVSCTVSSIYRSRPLQSCPQASHHQCRHKHQVLWHRRPRPHPRYPLLPMQVNKRRCLPSNTRLHRNRKRPSIRLYAAR